MKNKLALIISISFIYMPFTGLIIYQIIQNFNTNNLYMTLTALFLLLAAYILTLRSFISTKKDKV